MQRALTEVTIYTNNPDGSEGVVYRGRISVLDMVRHEWPMKKNVSSAGGFTVRASHPMAKLIARIPNTPEECKNVLVRVDRFSGNWRWTGLMHHWSVETLDGVDYLTASFNDDMQFAQFMLCRPNPLLGLGFQFPRDYFVWAPIAWGASVTGFLSVMHEQGLVTLPDDPGDPEQWADLPPFDDWQVHFKVPKFSTDSSLWGPIGARMNNYDSVVADPLEDGQLVLTYRRYFTAEGELVSGLIDNNIANGALVFEIVDRSGWQLPGGTLFSDTVVGGLARSVFQAGAGFIEDTFTLVSDDQSLYADEYWQSGWMGQFATAPTTTVRDSPWNDLQSKVTHSPATAVRVVVGGDNPTVDAIAQLAIQSTGNLIGYFLLGGFDSLGDIASDIIMPFLVGTILAWADWVNQSRKTSLGWVHLFSIYQQGAENNVWSLAATAAMRGGFKATEDKTNHTMVLGESSWVIPCSVQGGGHVCIGDRMSSSAAALQRAAGIDLLFVNQVEEMNLSGDENGGSQFVMKCGKNEAAMSIGERNARQLKFALEKLQDIGVRLIS